MQEYKSKAGICVGFFLIVVMGNTVMATERLCYSQRVLPNIHSWIRRAW